MRYLPILIVKMGKWNFTLLDDLVKEGWRVKQIVPVEMGAISCYILRKK